MTLYHIICLVRIDMLDHVVHYLTYMLYPYSCQYPLERTEREEDNGKGSQQYGMQDKRNWCQGGQWRQARQEETSGTGRHGAGQ